jgi:hypothetical protein
MARLISKLPLATGLISQPCNHRHATSPSHQLVCCCCRSIRLSQLTILYILGCVTHVLAQYFSTMPPQSCRHGLGQLSFGRFIFCLPIYSSPVSLFLYALTAPLHSYITTSRRSNSLATVLLLLSFTTLTTLIPCSTVARRPQLESTSH